MANYKTEAIVLKRRNFSEADRILVLYTRKFGKINAIAKGARRMTSKKGGSLELLNWCDLSMAVGQNLDLVLESQVKRSFLPVKHNLFKTSLAYQLIEVVDNLTIEHQPSNKLFNFLLEALANLSVQSGHLKQKLVVASFQLKSLQTLGFHSYDTDLSFFKSSSPLLVANVFRLSTEKLCDLELKDGDINTVFDKSQFLVEQTAEKQLKSSKFVSEIDGYYKLAA